MSLQIDLLPLLSRKEAMVSLGSFHKSLKHLVVVCLILITKSTQIIGYQIALKLEE